MLRCLRLAVPAVLAIFLFSISTLAQQAPPSADTFVSSSTPSTNYGSSIILVVASGNSTYVKFNLSGVPAGPSVSKATLRLFVDAVVTGGQFDVYNLPSAPTWSESTLKYNTPPPALGASATGGHPITVSSSSYNTFLLIDITATVQGWLTNPSSNNGVALALVGSTGWFSFDSKESFFTAHQPELEIVLNGPAGVQGATGATGATGPTGPTGAQGQQGLPGVKGDTGAQGQQGLPGVKGDTGAQGPQGLTGAAGSTGAQGQQGLTGAKGDTGAAGPMGPMGLVGPQGTAGTNGTNGAGFTFRDAFTSGATYATNDVVTFNGSTYVAVANQGLSNPNPDVNQAWKLMAQQGATGAAGPAGSAGANGAQGPQGFTGPQGPQGATGPQGPAGTGGTDPNSRMIFPSFFPGNLSGTWVGGQFILDQSITVLRIAATAKTPTGAACPAAVFRFTDGTKGQDLALTPGQYWSDSGPMVLTFAAGSTLKASLRTGSTCASNAGADANLLVEYKMQASGDTDSCLGTSCGGICTTTSSDPSNCGSCGAACASGVPCTGGTCGSGGSCNAVSCPTGCCSGNTCVNPPTAGSCGTGGVACLACAAGQSCVNGSCNTSSSCNPTSCPTGCCNGDICVNPPTASACGTGGGACLACAGCAIGLVTCSGSDICLNGACQDSLVCANVQTDPNNCGSCFHACGLGQSCVNGSCNCNPASCPTGCCNGSTCVNPPTGNACGTGGVACVACSSGQSCVSGVCSQSSCTPTTCATQGTNCGSISDGCGGTLNCGTCTAPQQCGSGGIQNVCGCTPTTCSVQGKNCGTIPDGCGGTLSCGSCNSGLVCQSGTCT